jgi:hypothetical protein
MAFRLLADEIRARRLSPGLSNEALDERATGHNVAPAVPGRMLQAPCSRYSPGKETPRRPPGHDGAREIASRAAATCVDAQIGVLVSGNGPRAPGRFSPLAHHHHNPE